MGIRVLQGEYDGGTHAAVMICSSSGWTVGPIFEAPDAEDQIEAFLQWLAGHKWVEHSAAIFGCQPDQIADRYRHHRFGGGDDPREWEDFGLGLLIAYWRSEYVGDDGWLLDPRECKCGHTHMVGDDDGDAGCHSCPCVVWTPGNRAAELRVAETVGG